MIAAPGQYVALLEQRAMMQGRRRVGGDVEREIDLAAFALRHHLRRRQADDRNAGAGCTLAQVGQRRQDDRGFAEVRRHDPPGLRGLGRIERLYRRDRALQCRQCLGQRLAQRIGTCGSTHAARARQQQWIVEQVAQARQLHADSGLGQMQALGRTGDVLLFQQGLQGHQQVEVDTTQGIVHGNAGDCRNSFQL
ncbi:hypothetical protein D3C81_518390 [compost metagenome]